MTASSEKSKFARALAVLVLAATALVVPFHLAGSADAAEARDGLPRLESLSLGATSVDVASGAATVEYRLVVTDDRAVSGGIGAHDAGGRQAGVLSRRAGTSERGLYTGTLTFPQGAANGTWRLSVGISDDSESHVMLSSELLAAGGWPAGITVTGGEDVAPRVRVRDLRVTPSIIDAGQGTAYEHPVEVTYTLDVSELDEAWLRWVYVGLTESRGDSTSRTGAETIDRDGSRWHVRHVVPLLRPMTSGTYRPWVSLVDARGWSWHWDATTLAAGGTVPAVRFTSAPPVLASPAPSPSPTPSLSPSPSPSPSPTAPTYPTATSDLRHACPAGAFPSGGAPDVTSANVHARAIDCLLWRGVTTGTASGRYEPAWQVTRGQMATFLARSLADAGVALPSAPADAFRDDAGTQHEHATNQLAALGIVRGDGAGGYGPGLAVRRDQMAAYLQRAYALVVGRSPVVPHDAFADDDGNVHEDAIDTVARLGLASGTAPGRFSPGMPVRRDQMASFLARLLDAVLPAAS